MRRLLCLALMAFGSWAMAATSPRAGTFSNDDERYALSFSLATDGPVLVQTQSFADGGFAPVLSLFDATGVLLQLDVGSSHTCAGAGSFCWDAGLSSLLPAGDYTLVLTQDGNLPLGPALADGFSMTGQPDFTGLAYLGQPGLRFVNVDGTLRTGTWAFTLQADVVPEPATGLLLVAGLGALAWRRRSP